jgi:hypothetical protein
MSNLAEQLLADIPTEEVVNPDAGVYEDATFQGGELSVTKKGGFQIVARFEAPRKDGVGVIRHREYINLPQTESHPRVKQMGFGWYKAFGIVPEGSKNAPMANDKNIAEKIVAALNAVTGSTVAISLSEDDSGFLRARPMRAKR